MRKPAPIRKLYKSKLKRLKPLSGNLSLKDLSKHSEVPIQSIYYYERVKLIPDPRKGLKSLHRRYSEAYIERLKFIKGAREAGFSISEIRKIIRFAQTGQFARRGLIKSIREKIDQVDSRLLELRRLRRILQRLSE